MNIILIYFAIKYQGDWDKIYQALDSKEKVSLKEISELELKIKTEGWNIITLLDLDYPKRLKEAYKPPFVLWYKGDRRLLQESFIAFTGNQVSENVKEWVNQFLPEVTKCNYIVTNSFKGVDDLVALKSQKPLLYIEASGLDKAKQVTKDDLQITEYPYGMSANADTYRNRNRLTSAFAQHLILLSSEKEGKINNLVSNFLNLGKEIYCFPGDGSQTDGNSELVKQGANLITSIKDISS